MKRNLTLLTALFLAICAVPAFAGGPLIIFDENTQTPYAYPGPVALFTDLDPMFSFTGPVTNAEADQRVADGIAAWTNVASSTFSGSVAGDFTSVGLPEINLGNVFSVINTFNGGGYHIIYDSDGSIVANLAGPGVLGFSGPEFANSGTNELIESFAVLNGATVDVGDVGGVWWQGVFTHEFGHGINLAHTQTNGAVGFFADNRGPAGCPPIGGTLVVADLETMYPFLDPRIGGTGIEQGTVELTDDVSSVSDVYPAPGWPASHATIEGTIFLSDGMTPVTGVNVVARNVADPWADCNSQLSGAFTQGLAGPDGRFALHGLTPGAQYVLYVERIVAGGFSTPPANPFPGPEEYYNGPNESGDATADDKCEATLLSAPAGGTVVADIIFNFAITLGDDDFVEVPLPFAFPFCGTDWNSVFIGSNGFLTFGAGSIDFSESVADLKNGPPRIAPMWVDLNPSASGVITAEEIDPTTFEVTFTDVPEFPQLGANSFTVTLHADGSFDFVYGAITAVDGLTGYSLGNGIPADPGPIDVSTAPQPISGAPGDMVYERFIGNNDLAGLSLAWEGCPEFEFEIAPATEGVCYGSTGAAGGGQLITIDVATGAGTPIGPSGLGGVPGLAINSAGEIYGTERISGDLYRLDGLTGQAYFVAPTGIPFLDGIAFDANDVLYGVGFDPPNFTLLIIDPTNGDTTPVGPTGDIIVGLAFDPTDGQLYGSVGGFQPVNPDGIYRIDKNTGAATFLGTTGFGGATPDLHFDDAGNMYASKGGGQNPNNLILVDKNTGAGTLVGNIGIQAVSGLATFHTQTAVVKLDIKPGSCPNPFNLKVFDFLQGNNRNAGGVLPVALLGSGSFDISNVDPTTLRLEGVEPLKTVEDDVATPFGGDLCGCHEEEGDGLVDISMKFRAQDIAAAISPGAPGSTLELTLTGELTDGTPFEASDCITFVGNAGHNIEAMNRDNLHPASPNPFNPVTTIRFSLSERGPVTLTVYDARGRLVERLVHGVRPAGEYAIAWHAGGVASGIYTYRLQTQTITQTRKMILMK